MLILHSYSSALHANAFGNQTLISYSLLACVVSSCCHAGVLAKSVSHWRYSNHLYHVGHYGGFVDAAGVSVGSPDYTRNEQRIRRYAQATGIGGGFFER